MLLIHPMISKLEIKPRSVSLGFNLSVTIVTSHYSRENTYKNIVIPEVFYRESTLNVDSC